MIDPRLQKFYLEIVCEDLLMLYNFTNVLALPKIKRAILTSTSNNFTTSKSSVVQSFCANYLQTSQKCRPTRARKSIDLFKIRQSNLLGLKLTLRNKKLFSFLDKVSIFVLPKLFSKNSSLKKTRDLPPVDHKSGQDITKNVCLSLSSPQVLPVEALSGLQAMQKYRSKNQKIQARKVFSLKNQPFQIGSWSSIVGKREINHTQNCFTISNKSSLSFLEISQLSIFFDLLPGFALSLYFSPVKDRISPKREKRNWPKTNCRFATSCQGQPLSSEKKLVLEEKVENENDTFSEKGGSLDQVEKTDYSRMKRYLLTRYLLVPKTDLQESNFSANRAAREHKIKKQLLSAFGFPWFVE